MPKGGERSRSGPPPDPQALKRNKDGADWTRLPAAGRTADAPDWPASVPEASVAELLQWNLLWKLPQAMVWEADRMHDRVALYVRVFLEAAAPEASAATRGDERARANELLLSSDAMHRLKYVIDSPNLPSAVGAPRTSSRRTGTARASLTVVPPPDAATLNDPDV